MKIAYITYWKFDLKDGVTKKILDQINNWSRNNCKVRLFCITPDKDCFNSVDRKFYSSKKNDLFSSYSGLRSDIDDFKPDAVYIRYSTWRLFYLYFLLKYKCFVEINSDDIEEIIKSRITLKNILKLIYNLLTRFFFLRLSDSLIFVTDELRNSSRFRKRKNRSITIPNGIHLETIETVKDPIKTNNSVFFIGSFGAFWHGIDKIENLASQLPDYTFHIIGYEKESYANVIYYGVQSEEQYNEVISQCICGISTLALHRKNMWEACSLKTREYLAKGFPIILGYEDTALKRLNCDWQLKLDNVEDNINHSTVQQIKSFLVLNRQRVVAKDEISNFIDSFLLEAEKITFIKGRVKSP